MIPIDYLTLPFIAALFIVCAILCEAHASRSRRMAFVYVSFGFLLAGFFAAMFTFWQLGQCMFGGCV